MITTHFLAHSAITLKLYENFHVFHFQNKNSFRKNYFRKYGITARALLFCYYFINVVGIICFLVEIGFKQICQNLGVLWHLRHPRSPPAPTVLLCTLHSAHKINGSFTTVSISIKSRFAQLMLPSLYSSFLYPAVHRKLDGGSFFTIQYQIGILFCSHHSRRSAPFSIN